MEKQGFIARLDRLGLVMQIVVHNRFVCDGLRAKGAIFVEELSEVPPGETVIFSAHGVSLAVREEARRRNLRVFDATCPLVTKVHAEVTRMRQEGREIVMIGHKGHPEVEGTMGQSPQGIYLVETAADVASLHIRAPDKLAYVTQTTLSVDDAAQVIAALKQRFPNITGPRKDDICYATQNRQDAVKTLAGATDIVLVVGSKNSSNSNRLREVAETRGARAHLIDDASQINPAWLEGAANIGVTAGASAPEVLVKEVVDALTHDNAAPVSQIDGAEEGITFVLPKDLQAPQEDSSAA